MKLHCNSCHRPDYHRELKHSAPVHWTLTAATLGLYPHYKPQRCVCCGNINLLAGFKKKLAQRVPQRRY